MTKPTLGDSLERMVAIQMTAYPDAWTDEEKREAAEKHLFGPSVMADLCQFGVHITKNGERVDPSDFYRDLGEDG